MLRIVLVAAVITVAVPAVAQDAAIRAVVTRFEAARAAHDPAALAATLAPGYEEISPVGDIDTREEVLGFYAPEKKRPAPAMTNDEIAVRASGDAALVTQRTSFVIPGGPARSIRVRYVARRIGGKWLLASAQYTPIPAAR